MMPLIPQRDFNRAKKRMQMGLHPAVLEAVERQLPAVSPSALRGVRAGGSRAEVLSDTMQPGVPAGTGVNSRPAAGLAGRFRGRQGLQYQRFLRQGPGGVVQEVHDYGGKADAQVFNRKLTPEIQALLAQQRGPTPGQHLSNTATAEDKLLAMATRQAMVDPRLTTGMNRRKFSRTPGMLRRY
jgi:hypothetical protein